MIVHKNADVEKTDSRTLNVSLSSMGTVPGTSFAFQTATKRHRHALTRLRSERDAMDAKERDARKHIILIHSNCTACYRYLRIAKLGSIRTKVCYGVLGVISARTGEGAFKNGPFTVNLHGFLYRVLIYERGTLFKVYSGYVFLMPTFSTVGHSYECGTSHTVYDCISVR